MIHVGIMQVSYKYHLSITQMSIKKVHVVNSLGFVVNMGRPDGEIHQIVLACYGGRQQCGVVRYKQLCNLGNEVMDFTELLSPSPII
jgi:hypothetical protein